MFLLGGLGLAAVRGVTPLYEPNESGGLGEGLIAGDEDQRTDRLPTTETVAQGGHDHQRQIQRSYRLFADFGCGAEENKNQSGVCGRWCVTRVQGCDGGA